MSYPNRFIVVAATSVILIAAMAAGLPALAQLPMPTPPQPAPNAQQPGGYSIQVKSRIVLLDVVVTNKKGENVKNLIPSDFMIYEDKVPQTIRSFDEVSPKPAGRALAISSTAELDRLEPNAPVSIIVLDEVSTKFEDLAFARYSLKKYLKAQGDTLEQPTMLVSVSYRHVAVLRDYTTSQKELLDALNHHLENYQEVLRSGNMSWGGEQVDAAFGSLIGVAEATSGHPGHKNMIWIGLGFPSIDMATLPTDEEQKFEQQLADCTTLLRDARVTLTTIDPAGLSADLPAQDEDGFYLGSPFGGQVDFDTMALATGGHALHGRNDVAHSIEESAADGQNFYTLSYVPPVDENANQFRTIRVLMKDRALTATTREGYYVTAAPVAPVREANGKFTSHFALDMQMAVQNLLVYDAVPLTIIRDPAVPNRFVLDIPVADLAMQTSASQKPHAQLTVMVASFDRKGKLLNHSAHLLEEQLSSSYPGGVPEAGFISVPVTIPIQPPAARLRFVVRANGNGRIGSGNLFLVDRKTLSDPATGLAPSRAKR